jgi:exosortase
VTLSTTLNNRLLLYAFFVAALIGANLETVRAHIDLARDNSTASHIILVPVVSLLLLVQSRTAVFSSHRTDLLAGLPVLFVGGVLLWLAGSLTVSVAGMLVLLVGAFLLVFGREASRAALFPLAFLIFAIPIPQTVLDWSVQVLKDGSTESVEAMFSVVGLPFHRDGYVFSLPSFTIEIADECSGIRSSIALLLTTVLAGHTFLGRPWGKLLLIALVLPVAILKNGIRIVGLSLLAMYVDPGFLTGQLHHEGGVVFFALSLLLLAPVVMVLRRSEAKLQPIS